MKILPCSIHEGNFSPDRGGVPIDVIVIHISEGSMASMVTWFNSPKAKVSAHYGISRAGEVLQFVPDEAKAFHAGRVLNPTAAIVKDRPGLNPNLYSIGIEHEGTASSGLTLPQMAASAELLRHLGSRHRIKLDRTHVIGHREVFAGKTCPGKVNVDALVELAVHGTKVTPLPLKLDQIEHPTAAHIEAVVKVRRLDPDEAAIGISVAEVLLRGVINADLARRGEVVKQAADAMSDWLKSRIPPAA
jgi:hypothetical protein